MATETVKLTTLRELVNAHSVRTALVLGQRGGWSVLVRYGMHERALAAKSGHTRLFKTVDGAVKVLRGIGLGHVELDATGYTPDALGARKRPDTANTMRALHAHDRWFRDQVQSGLADLDAGFVVSEEDHRSRWAIQRAALVNRAAAKA